MTLKYLIDENVNPIYPKQLRRRESIIVVRVVGELDSPSLGTLDPEILIWCESRNFILVTNNRTSMPVHLADHLNQDRHMPGIFILNPNLSIGDNLAELIVIAQGSFDEEYQDQIIHLPLLNMARDCR
jgi:hypothetical protein